MKKIMLIAVFGLVFFRLPAQNAVPHSGVEISFVFNRQSGFASNQFAVWIEDSRGNHVKTLFATRYTASGGWERRPLSIPLWVRQSRLSALNNREIDGFTGATPRTGALSYRWDGTDRNGNPAAVGEYTVFLEATLRNENRVLYSASFTPGSGSPVDAEIRTEYFGSGTRERNMIENVKIVYRR